MYNPQMFGASNAPVGVASYDQNMAKYDQTLSDNFAPVPMQQSSSTSAEPSSSSTQPGDVSLDGNNNDDDGEGGGKRRRVQRACDTCRKKKVRCDGLQPEKGACTNCSNYGYECTFVDAARKRAPPRSYVEAIEARLAKMEDLIATLAPGVDFTDRIGKPVKRPDEKGEEGADRATSSSDLLKGGSPGGDNADLLARLSRNNSLCEGGVKLGKILSPSHQKARTGSELSQYNTDEESEDDIAFIESGLTDTHITSESGRRSLPAEHFAYHNERLIVGEGVKALGDSQQPQTHKFIGKASAMHLFPLIERLSSRNKEDLGLYPKGIRPEYWMVPRGLLDPPADPAPVMKFWPQPDLAASLIDAYFRRINHDFPIINEAQFRHEYRNLAGLKTNPEWIARAFAIFAAASHFVQDDRVKTYPDDPHSRGIHWWNACKTLGWRNSQFEKPLWRVQTMLVCTLYQMSTPIAASAAWLILGTAVRLLQDVGAHRKQTARKLGLSRVDEESFKRCFWVAYSLDRECSASLGRPVMLQDEDIDVELPIEVDDHYLFTTPDNEPLPEQPKNTPAIIGGFLSSLRLDEIVGRTLKMIYSLHKTKVRFGFNSKEWDERIVTEIDSALNNWLDTVPDHLRYDPHETSDEWLMQSSLLYSKYYNCQILVHRPFIPARKSANEKSILNFPSLAICTNASRSISHLISNLKDRSLHNEAGIPAAFRSSSAAVILLMVIWGAKRNGGRVSSSASADLRRLMDVMKGMEQQWQVCGKLVDVLESLIASTHLSLPPNVTSDQGHKRHRDGTDVEDASASSESSPQLSPVGPNDSNSPDAGKKGKTAGRKLAGKIKTGPAAQNNPDTASRQLPLSTSQLASMHGGSSTEESPASATENGAFQQAMDIMSMQTSPDKSSEAEAMFGSFGPLTPQQGRPRFPSIGGVSGVPASFSFGMLTPSALVWNGVPSQAGNEFDYLQGPHSQAGFQQSVPSVTPSIFDSLSLAPATGGSAAVDMSSVPDFSDFSFGGNMPSTGMRPSADAGPAYADPLGPSRDGTPQSDGSSGIANYAFELLQKQSLWGFDEDSLNLLQQGGQRQ